ncbi:flagellar protein FliO/FliZ [Desulfotomaculum arcticum]|uniref:Flagellar protein FliO/FliZ n=1 Tax=Desulfotruncus arcticus DSM 17038 TaxID=1121424 RepID=A0A1I2MY90_9FIRM|nr:flagellar biosynthetic protein FliO [Desulfotruncus arcticus]SFF96068.1 flagellar protein FliO/FliZ [Desulfotomaculum arcticum] [Desulfotruncus arcticus DSM 17038]
MDKEMIAALIRLMILLPVICMLAYLTVKYGFGQARRGSLTGIKRMRLVEQISLGPKSGLSLVQVGKKYLLLAHQEGSIIMVKEMDQLPDELENNMPEWKSLSQVIKGINLFGGKPGK